MYDTRYTLQRVTIPMVLRRSRLKHLASTHVCFEDRMRDLGSFVFDFRKLTSYSNSLPEAISRSLQERLEASF